MEAKIINIEKAKEENIDILYKELSTGENGLTGDEARERIKVYGYNEITEKKVNPLLKFLAYFWGLFPG